MKNSIETMRQELKDDATFKDIYHFSFSFGLGENQKSLRMWNDRPVFSINGLTNSSRLHLSLIQTSFFSLPLNLIALDVAIPFWKLLLPDRFPRLDMWCDFVENKYGRSISKDTWYLVSHLMPPLP